MWVCQKKRCWLADLENVSAAEYDLWLVYFELEAEDHRKAQKSAEQKASMRRR